MLKMLNFLIYSNINYNYHEFSKGTNDLSGLKLKNSTHTYINTFVTGKMLLDKSNCSSSGHRVMNGYLPA